MIEKMWEILTTLTVESQQAALSKCTELGLDPNRGVVSLDESYINLSSACNILKDAIEKRKLIQLPISIQKVFAAALEAIAKHQAGLIAGSDEVVNLSDAIERLNANIWQYGLHNLSDELLGYQTKLNQLKSMEVEAGEVKRKLQVGIRVKENLERIFGEAEKKSALLQTLVADANTSVASINEAQSQTLESSQKATGLLTIIQQTETAVTQLFSSSSKSNAEILALENNLKSLLSGFTSLKAELEANKNTQEQLFEKFEGYRATINDLLDDANRTGLAASFTKRKNDLNVPMLAWLFVFAASITGLVVMGAQYLAPLLDSGKLEQLPSRLALTAPFIWLGWFSAKQYGYTSRLREDYAYKEASAKSFEGYKREANQVNPEMLKNLLDTAIKNLGDNPIRIYSGHENHASPLHEILEKSLKDEKLMDLLRAIFAKARG
ncbi:MAG TPA: hypothetical protein VMV48_11250 [Gallionellaceae bacterium]|nr:hypothetical protein [Gallionellaceae bacterium]